MELKSFLGTGWSFPPEFEKNGKSIQMVSDDVDIAESMKILLNTNPTERLMHPEYGCDLRKFVFERQDSSFITGINDYIRHSILMFEPRVKFINAVIVNRGDLDGVLYIQVNYNIIITNTRSNIVFPFYILEGTNIKK